MTPHYRAGLGAGSLILVLVLNACAPASPAPPPTRERSASQVESVSKPAKVAEAPTSTATPLPPTATTVPSATPLPPTATPVPPTATARPSATPLPGPGDVIFSTAEDECDWSSFGFEMSSGDWVDNYIAETDTDRIYIEVPTDDTTVYAECAANLRQPDVLIEVDATTVAGPNENNISLVCRMNSRGWYEAAINSGGYWYLYRYSDTDGYEMLAQGASLAINLQHATNHLSLLCAGDTIAFGVNGVVLTSVHDSRFISGYFGLSVTTFTLKGVGVAFEGLRVIMAGEARTPEDVPLPTG